MNLREIYEKYQDEVYGSGFFGELSAIIHNEVTQFVFLDPEQKK
jgi:hypothetical protein